RLLEPTAGPLCLALAVSARAEFIADLSLAHPFARSDEAFLVAHRQTHDRSPLGARTVADEGVDVCDLLAGIDVDEGDALEALVPELPDFVIGSYRVQRVSPRRRCAGVRNMNCVKGHLISMVCARLQGSAVN